MCDAVVDTIGNKTGFSWVVRDSEGMFIAAKCISKLGVHLPKEAKAIAIRDALTWIKTNQIEWVQAETYALSVVQSLKQVKNVSSYDLILLDIKDIMRQINHVNLLFVKYSANMIAHLLARRSLYVRKHGLEVSLHPLFVMSLGWILCDK